MKLGIKLIVGVFALVGLSGCYSTSSPKAVVSSVGQALKKDDYKSYRSFLTARAQSEIGSEHEFRRLQQKMKAETRKPTLRTEQLSEKGDLDFGGLYTKHRVDILLNERPSANATVLCKSLRVEESYQQCHHHGGHHGGGHRTCHTEWRTVIRTTCKVDSLQF